jgi:predicted 2-oxoglutarate/Fe(II)-dependent dioxygenase YbiX
MRRANSGADGFWIQSMIRLDGDRTLLYDLDGAIQRLAKESHGNPIGVQLAGVYHNLLRRWGRCEASPRGYREAAELNRC